MQLLFFKIMKNLYKALTGFCKKINVGSIRVILPTFILEPNFLYASSYFLFHSYSSNNSFSAYCFKRSGRRMRNPAVERSTVPSSFNARNMRDTVTL